MKTIKAHLRYVNQWSLIFWAFIIWQAATVLYNYTNFMELFTGLMGCALIWAFFMLGYNSLDRELEIRLERAKDSIRAEGV